MSDTAIRVEHLSKKYIIAHQQEQKGGDKNFREVITDGAKSVGSRLLKSGKGNLPSPAREEFWALNDISFEINEGDRVGIIGRNGAGKSTLLKILSRITEPTKGRIGIKGRVASLLEVGTGFHPELTGRENVYLNGAILGMSKVEIKRKFDEIVAFAEVEKFLDTPVKRYSSGMYVRLAFAVAAHLEPEVLIVDEVLAVGDTAFQKKCLGKLEQVGKEGRTVVFVSHDLKNISGLCSKAVLLDKGSLVKTGKASDIIRLYGEIIGGNQDEIYRVISQKLIWHGISNQHLLEDLSHVDDLQFVLHFETGDEDLQDFHIDCTIFNEKDECVVHTRSKFIGDGFNVKKHKKFSIEVMINNPSLSPGDYHMTVYIWTEKLKYEEYLWIDQVRLCSVSSISKFQNLLTLEELMSATVPFFNMAFSQEL